MALSALCRSAMPRGEIGIGVHQLTAGVPGMDITQLNAVNRQLTSRKHYFVHNKPNVSKYDEVVAAIETVNEEIRRQSFGATADLNADAGMLEHISKKMRKHACLLQSVAEAVTEGAGNDITAAGVAVVDAVDAEAVTEGQAMRAKQAKQRGSWSWMPWTLSRRSQVNKGQ